jgi:arginase
MSVRLISVPYHAARRDVGMGRGPEALIAAGMPGSVETIELPDDLVPEIARSFELTRRIAASVREGDGFPLVLSGNCYACLGVAGGLGGIDAAVWFDAHADFDTPDDNRSGFFDVMGLSALTGGSWAALCASIPGFAPVSEDRVVLVGARDLEPYQRERLEQSAVRRVAGLDELEPALTGLGGRAYVHVDLDVLDPSEGRANEYAAPGGLSLEDLEAAIALIRRRLDVRAASITAYDPASDPDGRVARAGVRVAAALTA